MMFDAWRERRRIEVDRLVALGVVMTALSPASTLKLLRRFVDEFVDPLHVDLLLDHLGATDLEAPAVELSRWMRPDVTQRGGPIGCVRWLAAGRDRARCVRFERRVQMPALEIELATLDDAWAASWPGLFVSFDVGRAVVITPDYEDVRCDVRAAGATPYR